jgi:FAD/FMN-containing dehydrogenase
VLSRGPLNWIGEGCVSRDHVKAVYADHEFERLNAVKAQVDPDNRFRFASVGITD